MTHFNNKNGFTLFELMLAIAIMAFILAPLFVLQFDTLRQMIRVADQFRRVTLAQNMLVYAHEQQVADPTLNSLNKKESKPPTQLSYERYPLNKHPQLKQIPGLYVERVDASWSSLIGAATESLATIVFKVDTDDARKKK